MARVNMAKPERMDDATVKELFAWVTRVESAVPNRFYVELNFPEYFKAKLGSTQVLWQQGELTLPEIQHIGIAVSKANGCPYCTAAFCTILNYGLGTDEDYVKLFADKGLDAIEDRRLHRILEFALKVNLDPKSTTDADVDALRELGLTDRGIVQLIHVVSDFASYNRINLALDTDYDYRDIWRQVAFHWEVSSGEPPGDDTRGVR